jgi:hypothetical protein
MIGGASSRMEFNVGHRDDSVAVSTPGQSGSWSSAHYRDLFSKWPTRGTGVRSRERLPLAVAHIVNASLLTSKTLCGLQLVCQGHGRRPALVHTATAAPSNRTNADTL